MQPTSAISAFGRPVDASAPDFWRTHLWLPLFWFGAVFCVLQAFELDPILARAWYFNVETLHWLGTGSGEWWARSLLHTGGGWLVRIVAAAAIGVWALSFKLEWARKWRRQAAFAAIAIALSTAVVGGLKAITNVDCPWDLAGFTGHNPYIALFADRPDALARAKCFPGAHSSSGFALVCLYFICRDRSPRLARWALGFGIALGTAFSIGQEARGAHFLSHDLTSAAIVWCMQACLYKWWGALPGSDYSRRPVRRSVPTNGAPAATKS